MVLILGDGSSEGCARVRREWEPEDLIPRNPLTRRPVGVSRAGRRRFAPDDVRYSWRNSAQDRRMFSQEPISFTDSAALAGGVCSIAISM